MSLLDDLNDYKLETSFQDDPPCNLHISYRADRDRGISKVAIVYKWFPQNPSLGVSTFPIVYLKNLVDEQDGYKKRQSSPTPMQSILGRSFVWYIKSWPFIFQFLQYPRKLVLFCEGGLFQESHVLSQRSANSPPRGLCHIKPPHSTSTTPTTTITVWLW